MTCHGESISFTIPQHRIKLGLASLSYLLGDEGTEHREKVRHDDSSQAKLLLQDAVASCALLQQVVDPEKKAVR